ncbi:MAG TPA: phosphatidylserine decarboxylase [Halieaceae bacterium]|nr:phosphatidylserine decarboxylase [Halieaceae bacterium]
MLNSGRPGARSRNTGFSSRLLRGLIAGLSFLVLAPALAGHVPVVEELSTLLDERPALRGALRAAIDKAELDDVPDTDAFLAYLDELSTSIPVERQMVAGAIKLHYIINQAPDDLLNEDEAFNAWLKRFVRAYGDFLDSPASVAHLDTFTALPNYNVDDYFVSPSGWLTFNQFFAREIKPGKRPIAEPRNDRVIVSPADAVFMGHWPIEDDSTITVKGATWRIDELLDGSPYADAFRGGVYMHSFLYVDDYHRYHVPVGGELKEVRNISGRVYLDVVREPDGSFGVVDGDTYQFRQERGLVVIDSPEVGLVAVLPIGMSFVSSVNLTPDVGATLQKGEEFGFFMFGGSDIVLLFQDRNILLDAEVGRKYLQGERIGERQP